MRQKRIEPSMGAVASSFSPDHSGSQFPYISCICPNKLNQPPAVNVYVYVCVSVHIYNNTKVIISMVEEPDNVQ